MRGLRATIEIEGDPEMLTGGEGIEEYEQSLKNAIVLSAPGVHPPDVSVDAEIIED